MNEFDGIQQLAQAFMADGRDTDQAWDYAALIGDVFQFDEEGRLLVYRDGALIDRVSVPLSYRDRLAAG